MSNCTSPPESGCYFNTTQETLSTCWNAGGSVDRVLGCADGPKFYCIGNASAISNEANTARLQTECVTKSKSQSDAAQGKPIKAGIVVLAVTFLAAAGIVTA